MTYDVGDVAILRYRLRTRGPWIVNGATSATPIVVSTTTPHGILAGDAVELMGLGGIVGANGRHRAANPTSTTFELAGTIGTGTYTSGGVVYDLTGVAVDPTAFSILVKPPTSASYTIAWGTDPYPVRDGVGTFRAHVLMSEAGRWTFDHAATGTAVESGSRWIDVRSP